METEQHGKDRQVSLTRRRAETCCKEGFSLTIVFVFFAILIYLTNKTNIRVQRNYLCEEWLWGQKAQKQRGNGRKHALLACQEDETCVALKHPDRKGNFKISLVKCSRNFIF